MPVAHRKAEAGQFFVQGFIVFGERPFGRDQENLVAEEPGAGVRLQKGQILPETPVAFQQGLHQAVPPDAAFQIDSSPAGLHQGIALGMEFQHIIVTREIDGLQDRHERPYIIAGILYADEAGIRETVQDLFPSGLRQIRCGHIQIPLTAIDMPEFFQEPGNLVLIIDMEMYQKSFHRLPRIFFLTYRR